MATTILPLLFVLYFIQKFYLRTSRQVKSLDLEAKSPLYQQFTETAEGISTVRAFGSQEWFKREFMSRLDQLQTSSYILLCMQRWLSLMLDMVVGAAAVVLVALACLTTSSSAGNVGVALTTILTVNTQLQRLISAWTQAESSLESVARTKDYEAVTPNENLPRAKHRKEPDESWPTGKIKVHNLTVEYGKGDDRHVALENVSFFIGAGQKFGVCGRTGRYVA
jgi:ABC-type multidrug transport system fused ATPase/permease subunit